MKYFFVFLLFWFLSSCITNVDFTLTDREQEVTLNCILRPDNDTVIAFISSTKQVLSTVDFEPVENAQVTLYEEAKLAGHFQKSDSSAYILPYRVQPGKKYKIEVISGKNHIEAECNIPNNIKAQITALKFVSYRYDYVASFRDDISEDNYYWITIRGYRQYNGKPSLEKAQALYSNYSYADDFNRLIETCDEYIYEYEDYIRIYDKNLPNDSIKLQFISSEFLLDNGPQEVFVLAVDYHLDKYMKSSLLMEVNDLYAEDVPIVYSPQPVYSNIHGGTGIFGSYTSVSQIFPND